MAFCIIWYPIELIIRIMVKKSQVKKDSSLELEKPVFDECLDEMIRDKREAREEREISGAGIWTLLFLDDLFDD